MVQKYIKTAVKRARARHHVSQCFYFTMVCLITKIPPKLLIFNRNSCPGNSTKGPGRKFQKNKHSGEKTLKKVSFHHKASEASCVYPYKRLNFRAQNREIWDIFSDFETLWGREDGKKKI